MSDPSAFSIYTVYNRPKDYPSGYVLRRFEVVQRGSGLTQDTWFAPTLEEIRQFVPVGLVRMLRDEMDDPVIVETWI